MEIQVYLSEVSRQAALQRFIEEKTMEAFERHGRYLRSVSITVKDINGDKGGVDKECKIVLKLKDNNIIVSTVTHTVEGQAFKEALRTTLQTLRKDLQKKQKRRKGAGKVKTPVVTTNEVLPPQSLSI